MEFFSRRWNKSVFLLLIFMPINAIISYDPQNPPRPVKEVCERSKDTYWYCIHVFNTGSVANGDMKFLSYYTRDFAENNATYAIKKINSTLMPNLPDPYIQQVLTVCMDAFSHLKDELTDRINPMITEKNEFEEAKAWVKYGIGLMYSCRAVCIGKPRTICPLMDNIYETQNLLKLLHIVLELLTEGFM